MLCVSTSIHLGNLEENTGENFITRREVNYQHGGRKFVLAVNSFVQKAHEQAE